MFYFYVCMVSFFVVLLGLSHESNGLMQISLMETAYSQKPQENVTDFGGLDGFTVSRVHDLAPVAELSPSPSILYTFQPPSFFRCSRQSKTNSSQDQAALNHL